MPTLYTAAALAVAAFYCVWRARAEADARRRRQLCRRVAYLLWVTSGAEGGDGAPCPAGEDFGYDEE
ncbi:MAG TPA: hypothetical protein VFW33_09915 [Gemmataceae bacterium]|nr:hypothetical protein [Gemmataceae bacterium]